MIRRFVEYIMEQARSPLLTTRPPETPVDPAWTFQGFNAAALNDALDRTAAEHSVPANVTPMREIPR